MPVDGFGTLLNRRATGGTSRYTASFPEAPVWVVNHNLGRAVLLRVSGTLGQEILAEVRYVNDNQAYVFFDVPTAGTVSVT
jgi:hypothetical protein